MEQLHTQEPQNDLPRAMFRYPSEEPLPKDIHEELTALRKTGMAISYIPTEHDAPYGNQPYELIFSDGEMVDSFGVNDILAALQRVKAERVN